MRRISAIAGCLTAMVAAFSLAATPRETTTPAPTANQAPLQTTGGQRGGAAPAAAGTLQSQEITQTSHAFRPMMVYKAQVSVVDISVVVRDDLNQIEAGLQKQDFELLDNGKPQTISGLQVVTREAETSADGSTFEVEGAAPAPAAAKAPPRSRSIAFLIDDLNTTFPQNPDLVQSRNAAIAYLKGEGGGGLAPNEEAAVYTTSGQVRLDYTHDTQQAIAALESIRPESRAGLIGCPLITPYQAYEIVYNLDPDALNLAVAQAQTQGCSCPRNASGCANEMQQRAEQVNDQSDIQASATLDAIEEALSALALRKGDRILLMESPGFPARDMQLEVAHAIDTALKAGVVVSTLDSRGLIAPTPGNGPDDPVVSNVSLNNWRTSVSMSEREELNDVAGQLAAGTGGSLFQNNNDLKMAVRVLTQEPATSYVLTFSPDNVVADGSLHTLVVKVKKDGHHSVQARMGYMAPPRPGSYIDMQQRINQAALATDDREGLPAEVEVHPGKLSNGDVGLHLVIQVNAKALPFKRLEERNLEQLSFVAVLNDMHGNYVIGEQGELNLRLTDGSRATASEPGKGLKAGLSMKAAPGSYQMRIVVQESVKGLLTSRTQTVVVP